MNIMVVAMQQEIAVIFVIWKPECQHVGVTSQQQGNIEESEGCQPAGERQEVMVVERRLTC